MVHATSGNLLGAHVGQSARDCSCFGDPTLSCTTRKTEVHDPDSQTRVVAHHHNILGFYVAMTDTARVTVFKRFGNLDSDIYDFPKRECAVAFEPSEICALDYGHYEEQ